MSEWKLNQYWIPLSSKDEADTSEWAVGVMPDAWALDEYGGSELDEDLGFDFYTPAEVYAGEKVYSSAIAFDKSKKHVLQLAKCPDNDETVVGDFLYRIEEQLCEIADDDLRDDETELEHQIRVRLNKKLYRRLGDKVRKITGFEGPVL